LRLWPGFSVLDVISAVKRAANSDFAVHTGPRRAGDPAALVAGAGRIREFSAGSPAATTSTPSSGMRFPGRSA
jgi:UDP-glucose 4-epimerase